MEYCYAPMEGITLSHFRRIHHEMFPGVSEYYTPFIAPDSNGGFRAKFLRELTTDCGQVPLIPQLLVNNAEAFCLTADRLVELGFREINLNVGCPSGTVFSKHKGAGMLRDLPTLDSLLDRVIDHAEKAGYRISVKTRMGIHSTEEFPAIMEIYEKYPIKKCIVHARCRDDFYQGRADLAGFAAAASVSRLHLVYNGDIAEKKDLNCYWFLYLQSRFVYKIYKALKPEFRGTAEDIFSYHKLNAEEISEIVDQSRIILDIQHPKQTGLTMRTIEMIGMNKKLITTNQNIKNYDFYNSDNIAVIDRKQVEIPDDFLKSPYIPISPEVYEKYSLQSWILEVLS